MEDSIKLNQEDIESLFWNLTEIEVNASMDAILAYPETSSAGQGYIMAIKKCRHILKTIMKDVE